MPTYALSIVSVSTLIASDDVVNSFLVALSDLGDVRNGHFPDTLEAFDGHRVTERVYEPSSAPSISLSAWRPKGEVKAQKGQAIALECRNVS